MGKRDVSICWEYVKLSRLEPEVEVADMYDSLFDDSDKDTKTPILFFR
jgi:hypothetical protein